ncbi:dTDP-glucose 4,6-dehydratase [Thermoproteota archaeon]
MKHILITGGAGFIGANFIHFLLKNYKDALYIHNVDALTYAGNLENLFSAAGLPNYKFYKADISKLNEIEPIFQCQTFDYVINFAAESHVDRSIMDAEKFIQTNILGTQILLDLSRKYNAKKYTQISTDEVYGSLSTTGFFTESSMIKPNSPYAASKAGADLLVLSYYKTHGFPCVITRCTNNYGPYQFPEKLIPLMIANAEDNKPLPVYGTGENIRDWIYVDDHCRAIDMVAQNGKAGEIYNIGSNTELTNIEVVKLILKILGKSESLIQFVKDRPGHDFRYALDCSKIKKELGWEPQVDFEQGIRKTVQWYLDNKSWWQHIISGAYQDYYKKQYQIDA